MNCQDAVKRAVDTVTTVVSGLPVYPFTVKNDIQASEYVSVNTLGFPSGILQKGIVNININVKDKQGFIDNKRLFELGETIKDAILTSNEGQEKYIDFSLENEQVYQEENYHLLNLRYHVVMYNE